MAAVRSISKSVNREHIAFDSIEDENILEFHKKKSQPTPNQMVSTRSSNFSALCAQH